MATDVAEGAPTVAVPRRAATVALIRDGEHGIEALLLRRTKKASFVAGAHVFPGGAVDETDSSVVDRLTHLHGVADDLAAAVRECFEECGVLLASTADGTAPSSDQRAHFRMELRDGLSFPDLLVREGLLLTTQHCRSWARWVTPVGSPKRFDTAFFVAAMPAAQVATPDDAEITECEWLRPVDALDRAARAEMLLITPTLFTLRALSHHATVAEVLRAAPAATTGPDSPRDASR